MTPSSNFETPESNSNQPLLSQTDENINPVSSFEEEQNTIVEETSQEVKISEEELSDLEPILDEPVVLSVETVQTNSTTAEENTLAFNESVDVPQQDLSQIEYYNPQKIKQNQTTIVGSVANQDEDLEEEKEFLDEIPDEVEMSLFDHLEELRQRIFYSLIAVFIAIIGCFTVVNPIVQLLQRPASGIKFVQLAPGEYFFVSLKVAGYSGLVVATPFILYQITMFVLPGLTRKERRLLVPALLGSSVLFLLGLGFAYVALIPAALNFFINYGADVVEQFFSIEKYFEFVLVLLFCTGIAFQIPVIQAILGALKIVSSEQMLSGWRYVILGGAVLGAVLTPSTDPLTQSLLAGAVLGLYFGGIWIVKLIENTSESYSKSIGQ
ncbi:Sec-independent protein translocase protein TatC [Planktothrix tepida]|uniref:Sec-independent protein translocase protein TatC n=1 Tax=Planktothrix tepida PCC 9214 TaxID=671072 RepID=A0A1J1LFP1_9CYAN|nr:Sec-independent protein translocase protein TatC [Planktothrix tepida]CUR30724.1 Sec-independent protein translocase protein TatC (modular protein) [Planktothrix tepida PCC 9214]